MKLWESMLAMALCMGLVVSLGLTACGDDEEDLISCAEALNTLTSDACLNAAAAALPGVQACLAACDPPDDENCIGDCLDDFTLPSSCEEAITALLDPEEAVCGSACVDCGQDFVDCVVDQEAPQTCLTELSVCAGTCLL
jgi:hypothetical protein